MNISDKILTSWLLFSYFKTNICHVSTSHFVYFRSQLQYHFTSSHTRFAVMPFLYNKFGLLKCSWKSSNYFKTTRIVSSQNRFVAELFQFSFHQNITQIFSEKLGLTIVEIINSSWFPVKSKEFFCSLQWNCKFSRYFVFVFEETSFFSMKFQPKFNFKTFIRIKKTYLKNLFYPQ
jgi:hypothetical protein